MMQKEIYQQGANRESMNKQIKQAMEALTTAGEGVWDEVRIESTVAVASLVESVRESHMDMIMGLSHQVSLCPLLRLTNQLRESLSTLASEVSCTHKQSIGTDHCSMAELLPFITNG